MSDVRLENVRKSFKDIVAVDDLSLVRERRLR
jgi:ABC-type sugar transport system ATPase subunit